MPAPTTTASDFVEAGRKLFAGEAVFVTSAQSLGALPDTSLPEIAFAGRSNVGKSSLINALTGRKALARTSHTPGRTQDLNVFRIGAAMGALTVVDLPGYGYAAVGKGKVAAWTRHIHEYFKGRPGLARVYLLVDARHGLKAIDTEALDTLDRAAVSYQVVLTKADALKAPVLERLSRETEAALAKRAAAFPEVIATSSHSGAGVGELRAAIARLVVERGGK